MKLPHGWVLIRGFNLCCEVHRCHLMGCEIPGQRGQPLCWPYCMFQVVNPWCALQGWTAPAMQSHLLKLLSLLYMKIHEIKLKISVPFTLTYIYFCFVFNVCLFFFFTWNLSLLHSEYSPMNTAEWLHFSIPWWHELALCLLAITFCLLLDPCEDVCLHCSA